MLNFKGKSGFTLAEVAVSTAIIGALAVIMLYVFRSNLNTMSWGQNKMDLHYRVQVLMKRFYTDIKKISPIVYLSNSHLLFKGEENKSFFPTLVGIGDLEEKLRGKSLYFRHINTRTDQSISSIEWKYDKEKKAIVREIQHPGAIEVIKEIVANNISELYFYRPENDLKSVRMTCKMFDAKDPKKTEDIDITVRLECDMLTVQLSGL